MRKLRVLLLLVMLGASCKASPNIREYPPIPFVKGVDIPLSAEYQKGLPPGYIAVGPHEGEHGFGIHTHTPDGKVLTSHVDCAPNDRTEPCRLLKAWYAKHAEGN